MDAGDPRTPSSDVAFSAAVKAIQARKGSRDAYARMEARGGWRQDIDDELASFIQAQASVFLATASADGQPYIQHRGGPPGFLQVLDARTIAFADFTGNRQYISHGNLSENPKAQLFLIDYAERRRVKLWGTARVVEGDAQLLARLMPDGCGARAQGVLLFSVSAWDVNCPQHIPQRFDAEVVRRALDERDARIAQLESELAAARSRATAA